MAIYCSVKDCGEILPVSEPITDAVEVKCNKEHWNSLYKCWKCPEIMVYPNRFPGNLLRITCKNGHPNLIGHSPPRARKEHFL